jgi:TPR repeat protein
MAENAIGLFPSIDLGTAVRYYERCHDHSPAGAACLGWCSRTGSGIPMDFNVAAECFKQAADSNDAAGVNGFGCCLERGEGIDPDIRRAVFYYRRAALLSHRDGLYNYGRCLEYGKGIGQDATHAAKYYRLSAQNGNAAAENSLGICLERGIGAGKNLSLAADFYRRAAEHGHADGANNFGFCLEYGRGVQQSIEMALGYYEFAADRGHPEAKLNRARCLRLLGRWDPPDRSSETVSHPPSADHLGEIFRDLRETAEPLDDEARRLANQLKRLKLSTPMAMPVIPGAPDPTWVRDEIKTGDSSVVVFSMNAESNLIAMKTSKTPEQAGVIHSEAAILETLKHPLVLEMRGRVSKTRDGSASIVTEYAGLGSLASFLSGKSRLRGPNRIAKVIAGIALAMRFVHSRCVVHSDLQPENILLHWNWSVRIADFSRSIAPESPSGHRADGLYLRQSPDFRYLAPECFDGICLRASDVFAFGIILLEILTGAPAYPESLRPCQIMFTVSFADERPEIPDSIPPRLRALIQDCWATDPDDQPTFEKIVDQLAEMEFKVTADVNSAKVAVCEKDRRLGSAALRRLSGRT